MTSRRRFARWFIALLGTFAVMSIGGLAFLNMQERWSRERIAQELSSIAEFKCDQIELWRTERLSDARILSERADLSYVIDEFMRRTSPASPSTARHNGSDDIMRDFRSLTANYGYKGVALADTSGKLLLHYERIATKHIEHDAFTVEELAALELVVANETPVYSDMYIFKDARGDTVIQLSILAPIFRRHAGRKELIAVVTLVMDPSDFLFPLLQKWPVPSHTAEALLVRRDGDHALFMNELRHKSGTSMRMRIPLSQRDLPAAAAILGMSGEFEGRDYRNIQVISSLLAVPSTTWFMVVKVDRDEALADTRLNALYVVIITFLIALMLAFAAMAFWERGNRKNIQTLINSEQERRRIEEKLFWLSRAVEQSPAAVIITDLEGRMEYVNPAFCRASGYTAAEVLGNKPGILKSGETSPETYDDLWKTLKRGEEWRGIFHNRRKDGSLYMEYASISGIKDETGRTTHYLAVKEDITEQKRMERELRESETFLLECQRIAGVGSYLYHVNAEKWEPSVVLREILGVDATAPLNYETWISMLHPDDRASLHAYFMEEVLGRKQPFDREYRIIRPNDGATRWMHGRGALSIDANGNVLSLAGTIQDVTRQKRLDLELLQAVSRAEAANRAKSDFLARMSHELRTPLNSVLGFATILMKNKDGNLDETELEYCRSIVSNGKHLLGLINSILNIEKIESGQVEVEWQRADISELVRETVKNLEASARPGVELSVDVPDHPVHDMTDPSKLRQILVNLIGNALKFTEKGAVRIILVADAASNLPVRIEIIDSGAGIPHTDLGRIFEAFVQVNNADGRHYEGTGLGLSITRSLAKLLGCRIEVESEIGKGSTFRVHFPPPGTGASSSTHHTENAAYDASLAGIIDSEPVEGGDEPMPFLSPPEPDEARAFLATFSSECDALWQDASSGNRLKAIRSFANWLVTQDAARPALASLGRQIHVAADHYRTAHIRALMEIFRDWLAKVIHRAAGVEQ